MEDILEEIVGEIADEYDFSEIPESERLPDGSWRVSARMQLDDFADLFDLDLSEGRRRASTPSWACSQTGWVLCPIPGFQHRRFRGTSWSLSWQPDAGTGWVPSSLSSFLATKACEAAIADESGTPSVSSDDAGTDKEED